MNHFQRKHGRLLAEEVDVEKLAQEYGTPLYVYSTATFRRHYSAFDSAFSNVSHLTCYSAKANGNMNILKLLGEMGAGVDIVSGGELYRALKAGIPGERIVFSGVAKTEEQIRQALNAEILQFNVESLEEMQTIGRVAQDCGKTANVAVRINPDVDPQTHPYISTGMKKNKFGLAMDVSLEAYRFANAHPALIPTGIDCHIGSQLTSLAPFMEALDKVLAFYQELRNAGIAIKYLDLGGGLGIQYNEEEPPHPEEFGKALTEKLKSLPLTLILEPGRVIAGNAGILVFKALYNKKTELKHFVIVDAAMNDLVRPSLYGSYHRIEEVVEHGRKPLSVDIVGGICESTDFLARDRELPAIEPGEYLAAFSAGAYGFSMSSQYNARPRAAEVLVDGTQAKVIRQRESYEDLTRLEEIS